MSRILELLYEGVRRELSRKYLSDEEKTQIDKMLKSMKPETFRGQKIDVVIPALSRVFAGQIKTRHARKSSSSSPASEDFDLHEMQKEMLGSADTETVSTKVNDKGDIVVMKAKTEVTEQFDIDDFLGVTNLTEFKMLFNPESLYQHFYVVLDSDYRDTTSENPASITSFTWKYAPTQDVGMGFCNSVGVIKDIIGMRMYQPRVPYLAGMNTSAKRVSVLIQEFSAQAFICENGRRFHFLLRPDFATAGTDIELSTEDYNDGIFSFRKPITEFNTLTVSFGDPLELLSFSTPFNRFMIPIEFTCYKSDK